MARTTRRRAKLTAENLKGALWDTMKSLEVGEMEPATADAMAAQAREILRTVRIQGEICTSANQALPAELVDFATNGEARAIAAK